MKLQPINIQDTTTTVNEVLMLVEISPYGIPTKKFHPDSVIESLFQDVTV